MIMEIGLVLNQTNCTKEQQLVQLVVLPDRRDQQGQQDRQVEQLDPLVLQEPQDPQDPQEPVLVLQDQQDLLDIMVLLVIPVLLDRLETKGQLEPQDIAVKQEQLESKDLLDQLVDQECWRSLQAHTTTLILQFFNSGDSGWYFIGSSNDLDATLTPTCPSCPPGKIVQLIASGTVVLETSTANPIVELGFCYARFDLECAVPFSFFSPSYCLGESAAVYNVVASTKVKSGEYLVGPCAKGTTTTLTIADSSNWFVMATPYVDLEYEGGLIAIP